MANPNHELVWRAIRAYNARDVEGLLAVAHPDLVWRPMAATAVDGSAYEGHAGVVRYFEESSAIWERMEIDVDEISGEGEAIVLVGRIRARGRGSEADVETPAALVLEVRDGLLARCDTYRSLDERPR